MVRVRTCWPLLVAIVAIVAIGPRAAAPPGAGAPGPEVRFVAAGIAHFREDTGPVQARVSWSRKRPKESVAISRADPAAGVSGSTARDEEQTRTARWYYEDGKAAVIVDSPVRIGNTTLRYQRATFDGKEVRILQYLAPPAASRREPTVLMRGLIEPAEEGGRTWQSQAWADLRYYAYYEGLAPLDRILLDSDPPAAFRGEERGLGARLIKIEAHQTRDRQLLVWVDRDHSMVLRKLQVYERKLDGKMHLSREIEVATLAGCNDIWIPGAVSIKDHVVLAPYKPASGLPPPPAVASLPRRDLPPGSNVKRVDGAIVLPPEVISVSVSDVIVATPPPPEIFAIDWPIGTRVQDVAAGTQFDVVAKPWPDSQGTGGREGRP